MAKKRASREGNVPPPKCKAILLCERTIIEADTRQVSLIGVFDEMEVHEIPGFTRPFSVYLSLTDGIVGHPYDVRIEIHDLSADSVAGRAISTLVEWKDRLVVRQLLIAMPPQPVEQAGTYDVVVFANGQEVERRRFVVLISEPPEEE